MRTVYINHATAMKLRLRGKSLDIFTDSYYNTDKELESFNYYEGDGTGFNSLNLSEDFLPESFNILAPSQAVLQKAIREQLGIHITVHHYKNEKYSVSVSDNCHNCLGSALFGESFDTYEEALEAGLYLALDE